MVTIQAGAGAIRAYRKQKVGMPRRRRPTFAAEPPLAQRRRFAPEVLGPLGEPSLPENRYSARSSKKLTSQGMPSSKSFPKGNSPVASRKMRCVIVEDQVMFEQMLGALLEARGGFEVAGVAHSVARGIEICESLRPDLLVLDLALPDGDGMKVARRLAALCPDSRTIVVSAHASTFRCPSNLRQAIFSVVDKTAGVESLLGEIMKFHGAAICQNPEIQPLLDPVSLLSERELEVFRCIGMGLGTKEIAAKLGRAYLTIETHRRNLAAKLGTNRGDLVKMAALHNQMPKLRED